MNITMLGTGNAMVTECYNTCFVLEDGDKHLLVDGGGGNTLLRQLKQAGFDWKDMREIFVVAVRDHVPVEKLNEQMTYLSERYNGRFISLNTLNIDISSQLLRKWHQEGKSLRYYVPDAVADYIDKNHIYHITEGVGHNNV